MHHKVTTGMSTILYGNLIRGCLKLFLPPDECAGWNMFQQVLHYEAPVSQRWGLFQPRPPSCSPIQKWTVVPIDSPSDLKRAVYWCWNLPSQPRLQDPGLVISSCLDALKSTKTPVSQNLNGYHKWGTWSERQWKNSWKLVRSKNVSY